jgi:hypothetical protein
MNKEDYVLVLKISEKGLAEGKRPPLCDGCSEPISCDGNDDYTINCLILDGETFHSVQCDKCIEEYFKDIPKLKESEAPKKARQTVRLVMSRDMEVMFL